LLAASIGQFRKSTTPIVDYKLQQKSRLSIPG
jgi:hypothetical protein